MRFATEVSSRGYGDRSGTPEWSYQSAGSTSLTASPQTRAHAWGVLITSSTWTYPHIALSAPGLDVLIFEALEAQGVSHEHMQLIELFIERGVVTDVDRGSRYAKANRLPIKTVGQWKDYYEQQFTGGSPKDQLLYSP